MSRPVSILAHSQAEAIFTTYVGDLEVGASTRAAYGLVEAEYESHAAEPRTSANAGWPSRLHSHAIVPAWLRFALAHMTSSFQLTSSRMVGLDPGYDLDDVALMGCLVEPCRLGVWRVQEFQSTSPRVPGPVVVLHTSISRSIAPESPDWQPIRDDIGGDGGVEGLYDIALFGDATVIPSDYQPSTDWSAYPSKRWYGYICDVVLAKSGWGAVVHPFGCTIHWDGGCSVSTLADADGNIVGVRLWPFDGAG